MRDNIIIELDTRISAGYTITRELTLTTSKSLGYSLAGLLRGIILHDEMLESARAEAMNRFRAVLLK